MAVKGFADFCALLSAGFLSVPAWYINRYAHMAARTLGNRPTTDDLDLRRIYLELLKELRARRDDWKPWKAWFLHIGTVAGLLAALLTFLSGLAEKAPPPTH
jgi:hypothetical protein